MGLIVYNRTIESHSSDKNNYRIFRPSILGNPYTHLPVDKTKAIYQVKSRDEAVENYSKYFDIMYRSNLKFKAAVDEIYEKYKSGETIWLECYCHPQRCHGDIIKEKLEKRLIKERFQEIKAKKNKDDTVGQHNEALD